MLLEKTKQEERERRKKESASGVLDALLFRHHHISYLGKSKKTFYSNTICRHYILMVLKTLWKWSEPHFMVWWRYIGETDGRHFSQVQILRKCVCFLGELCSKPWEAAIFSPYATALWLCMASENLVIINIVNLTASKSHRRGASGHPVRHYLD